jgi:hypothetical protein
MMEDLNRVHTERPRFGTLVLPDGRRFVLSKRGAAYNCAASKPELKLSDGRVLPLRNVATPDGSATQLLVWCYIDSVTGKPSAECQADLKLVREAWTRQTGAWDSERGFRAFCSLAEEQVGPS